MLDNKKVTELLRKKGFKVTPQRLAVYNALCNTKSHPNADMIYNKLQPYYPTMSLATIYKTVDILHSIGLINILNTGEESFRYDARTDSHAHVCCTECGKVEDLPINMDDCMKEAEAETHYELQRHQLYFYGLCPECRMKKKTENH